MNKILLVGAGGFVGSILRYLCSGLVYSFLKEPWFPVGTLVVNTTGCLAIGFLAGLADLHQIFTPEFRLFVFIGLLGGFTTFSTFGYELFYLLRQAQLAASLANAGLHLVLGLAAVWAGHSLAKLL